MKWIAGVLPLAMVLAQTNSAPGLEELKQMGARFAPAEMRVDTSHLSAADRAALLPLIRAGRLVDKIFLNQYWSGDAALYREVEA